MSGPDVAPSGGPFSETMEVIFQHTQYIVTVSTSATENLVVEVECKHDANRWRGDFSAKYIEDITSKAGNYKKYSVFVRMLLSALKQGSDSVFVDLLTYADLEMLKARREKSANGVHTNAKQSLPPNNKRYLILTYAAEFDRVHFPLPLVFEEHPNPETLKRTISTLRAEVETLQASALHGSAGGSSATLLAQELRNLRQENASLREELSHQQASGMGPEVQRLTSVAKEAERELRLMRKEKEALLNRAEAAELQLDRASAAHRRELRKKVAAASELEAQLKEAKDELREMRSKMRMLTEELDMAKRRAKVSTTRQTYGTNGRTNSRRTTTSNPGSRIPSPGLSRSSSRGASQPSSRAPSPRTVESSKRGVPNKRPVSATAGRTPSRPNSAGRPGPGRFDPTAYVHQKQATQRQKEADRSRRSFSPAGSRQSSGRSTPTRDASFDQGRRHGSRGSSVERSRRASSEDGAARRSLAANPSNQRSSRAGLQSHLSSIGKSERPSSPGAALQNVKEQLEEFSSHRMHQESPDSVEESKPRRGVDWEDDDLAHEEVESAEPRPSKKSGAFDDATEEIASIDQRLHALQNFLKAAKQGNTSQQSRSFR